MRWFTYYPKNGDTRYISKFLFLPLTIDNQTRWLERISIRQIYVKDNDPLVTDGWRNTNFKS